MTETPLSDVLDVANLEKMVAEGFIRATRGEGMTLYNYTERAQYGHVWNPETLACRGLVVRDDGNIQSRPFGKFFNLSEHDSPYVADLPIESFDVFEKLDGSLIVISTAPDGSLVVTSRGSFTSEHAMAARRIWDERYGHCFIPQGETWCFELIAPWNRIVVDYGGREDLVLLARIHNATGLDACGREMFVPTDWGIPEVRRFDGLSDFDAIRAKMATLGDDQEGYVLRFESGVRAKAKGAEYVRLHRIVTGVSARTIWECLAAGQPLDEMLQRVPDEFYKWVRKTADDLLDAYAAIERACLEEYGQVAYLLTRKEQAMALQSFEHKAVVFAMLDDKDHDDRIWRTLKPAADRPFKVEEN